MVEHCRREKKAMNVRSEALHLRARTTIRAAGLVEIGAYCPVCGQHCIVEGIPGEWTQRCGCRCFPPSIRAQLIAAASDRLRDANLDPCPQCNHLMENACGARCRHCGFKYSCSGEP